MWTLYKDNTNVNREYTFSEVSAESQRNRIDQLYALTDEILAIFKGQITYEELKKIPYKEALELRKLRISRLEKEAPNLDDLANM
jgi:predicted S18 family serine protease